jgi:hypothetical protein
MLGDMKTKTHSKEKKKNHENHFHHDSIILEELARYITLAKPERCLPLETRFDFFLLSTG